MTLTQITKIRGPGIHTTSNIVSHNINSSGIITAVAFKGPFTGSSDIQSGILTATKIDLNGDIDVDGHTNLDNVSVAGVATFTGDATFSGNVSIGGTLTYEDVTNIDSVGIITARAGIKDSTLTATHLVYAGANGRLTGSSNITYDGTTFIVAEPSRFADDVFINVRGKSFKTSDWNITNTTSGNALTISGGGSVSEKIRINSSGKVGIGSDDPDAWLHIQTSSTTGDEDLIKLSRNHYEVGKIRRSAGNMKVSGEGNLYLESDYNGNLGATDSNIIFTTDADEKVRITSAGKVGVGTDTPTGILEIDAASTTEMITLDVAGSNFAKIGHNSSSGVAVLDVRSEGHTRFLTGGNSERLRINSSGHISINGSNVTDVNYLTINGSGASNNVGIVLNKTNSPARAHGIQVANTTGDLVFYDYTASGERLRIDASGHILPGAAGTQDLGSTSKEFRNLYLGNSGAIKLGSSQVGDLYNDGTDTYFRNSVSNGQTLIRSGGNIWISDYAGNHRAAFRDNSAVDLYFDIENNATAKLSTTVKGISVHGEVAASQDYPVIKPSLNLNFAATKSLDPRIKYYRHGPASYVDQTGRVVLVGENIPRFDHDPVTRECKGLLVEEAKTNYAVHSTTLLNSDYNYLNSTKVGYSATAPDGTNNATLMYPSSSGSGRGIEDTYTLPSTGKWTTSVYVKSAGLSWVMLYGVNGGTRGWFNVSTGAKGGNTGGSLDYDIIDAGNGWYRIWVTYNLSGTGGTEYFYIYFSDADNGTTVTANGTNGIYMWGLQVEKSDFPTSYIPTYGIIQTRGADNPFMDAIDDSFYSQDEGTAIIEYNYNEDSDGAHTLFAFTGKENDPDSSNPRQWLRINKTAGTARSIRYSLTTDAGSTNDDSSAVATPGQWDKFAFAYTAGDQDLYLNGSSINDLSRTPPTNCYRLAFGNVGWALGTETITLEGHIKRFIYYPKKLPNSQLGTITS